MEKSPIHAPNALMQAEIAYSKDEYSEKKKRFTVSVRMYAL